MWGTYYNSTLSNLRFHRAGLQGQLEQTELSEYCFSPDTSRYLMITWVAKWCKRWIDWPSWRGCLHPAGKWQGTEWVGKGMALSGWQGASWETAPGRLQASTASARRPVLETDAPSFVPSRAAQSHGGQSRALCCQMRASLWLRQGGNEFRHNRQQWQVTLPSWRGALMRSYLSVQLRSEANEGCPAGRLLAIA